MPGEHDTADATVTEYFNRFGKASNNKGYYSFDHAGVHFIALICAAVQGRRTRNPGCRPACLGGGGPEGPLEQHAHCCVRTHAPVDHLRAVGWGTGDADQLMSQLRRFGSVTVLNGHIHQIVQKVEGNVTFPTARSTAYPQPIAGEGPGPGPLNVSADQLPGMLGVTSVSLPKPRGKLVLNDTTITAA